MQNRGKNERGMGEGRLLVVYSLLDLLVTVQSYTTQEIRQRITNSKKLKKRYLSQVLLDTDGKGHEPSEKNYEPWHNIQVKI